MFVVIFEVYLTEAGRSEYFSMAADLRKFLTDRPGFISIERFQSTSDRNKLLSISSWEEAKERAEMFMLKNAGKNGVRPADIYPLVEKIS